MSLSQIPCPCCTQDQCFSWQGLWTLLRQSGPAEQTEESWPKWGSCMQHGDSRVWTNATGAGCGMEVCGSPSPPLGSAVEVFQSLVYGTLATQARPSGSTVPSATGDTRRRTDTYAEKKTSSLKTNEDFICLFWTHIHIKEIVGHFGVTVFHLHTKSSGVCVCVFLFY